MDLVIGMADTVVRVTLLDQAEKALPLLRQVFADFSLPEGDPDGTLRISVRPFSLRTLPLTKIGHRRPIEQRLPLQNMTSWLEKTIGSDSDFPIGERTVVSFFLNALLLFDPDSARGWILLREGKGCHWPLYRLCWIYWGQVLGERGGCFVHGAGLMRNDKGFLFLGPSGAGKTTLAKRFGGSAVLSDESPVLRKRDGAYLLYPSPYRQTDSLPRTEGELVRWQAPLQGLYFLQKDRHTYLEPLSRKEALPRILLQQILFLRHLSAPARAHLFHLFCDICDRIPPYSLHVSLDQNIWETIDTAGG